MRTYTHTNDLDIHMHTYLPGVNIHTHVGSPLTDGLYLVASKVEVLEVF